MKSKINIFLPFILTAAVIAADQVTKFIVLKTIEPYSGKVMVLGDFLRIILVYNNGAAFSLGHTLKGAANVLVLGILPSLFIIFFIYVYFKSDFTNVQRWLIAGIFGGGIGNLLDRFLRPEGVVDFIDVKFFGLFGLDRWPTFNVADSAIVVCMIGLIISIFIQNRQTKQADDK